MAIWFTTLNLLDQGRARRRRGDAVGIDEQPVASRAAGGTCAGRPPPLAGILTEGVAAQVGVRANEVVGGVAHEVGRADGEGCSKVVDAAAVDGGGIGGQP